MTYPEDYPLQPTEAERDDESLFDQDAEANLPGNARERMLTTSLARWGALASRYGSIKVIRARLEHHADCDYCRRLQEAER